MLGKGFLARVYEGTPGRVSKVLLGHFSPLLRLSRAQRARKARLLQQALRTMRAEGFPVPRTYHDSATPSRFEQDWRDPHGLPLFQLRLRFWPRAIWESAVNYFQVRRFLRRHPEYLHEMAADPKWLPDNNSFRPDGSLLETIDPLVPVSAPTAALLSLWWPGHHIVRSSVRLVRRTAAVLRQLHRPRFTR
jgi:hypothetical protein